VDFQPPKWLSGPHVQTLTAAMPLRGKDADLCIRVPIDATKPERGSGHALMYFRPQASGGAQLAVPCRTVLLVHGVGGAASSSYVRRAANAFYALGYQVARLELRGAGESGGAIPDLYHMGLTDDLEQALHTLAARADVGELYLVGFSGGGSLSLRMLALRQTELAVKLVKVAALSPPLRLGEVRANVERKRCLPYHMHVLRGLHRSARRFVLRQPQRAPFGLLDIAKSIHVRAFDANITVPMHGFASVDSYDDECSVLSSVGAIRTPTLVVHAEDDPMVPVRALLEASFAPCVDVRISKQGGHLGWAGSARELESTWAIRQVQEFFARA
jgi:uncharacterized protein